jgi:hypothetical protein
MAQPPSHEQIAQLLAQLKTGPPGLREQAARSLGEIGVANEHVVNALNTAATNDPDYQVRERARLALRLLGHTPPESMPPPAHKPVPFQSKWLIILAILLVAAVLF